MRQSCFFKDTLKNTLQILLILSIFQPASADVASSDDPLKLASDKVWYEKLKPAIFKDREIIEGTAQDVLVIKGPYRVEDAANVPISIHTKIPQTKERYIEKIHVYVDENPLPLVGIFEFGSNNGKADLAMRIRIDKLSYVRAIAETNDGKLYMTKTFVRGSGACSAPPPADIENSMANLGKMKIKTGFVTLQEPALVQVKIKHPSITGMQPLTAGSSDVPPPHFVDTLEVDFNGQSILKASLTFAITTNPAFRFFILPTEGGIINVKGTDTKKNSFSDSYEITL